MRWPMWFPGSSKRRHQQEAADQARDAEVARVAAIRQHIEDLADGLAHATDLAERVLEDRSRSRHPHPGNQ